MVGELGDDVLMLDSGIIRRSRVGRERQGEQVSKTARERLEGAASELNKGRSRKAGVGGWR